MSKEAMKLALEALQKIYIAPEHEEYIRVWWPACEQAITALREALAEQPAQQEPVALLPVVDVCMRAEAHGIDPQTKGLYGFYVDCISSSPQPAQRKPWVGLTEQEAAECWSTSTIRTWQAIEAKLREKNQ